jgi:selenide,water dikinase
MTSATINYGSIAKIEGLQDYLSKKTIPDATSRNWNSYSKNVQFEKGVNVMEAFNVLPDPQTNGGLLISVSEEGLQEVEAVFTSFGLPMISIGKVMAQKEKLIYVFA